MKTFKKLFIISTLIGALLLSGCDVNINGGGNNNNNNNTPDNGDSGNNNNPSGGGEGQQGGDQGQSGEQQGGGDQGGGEQQGGDQGGEQGGGGEVTPTIGDTSIRIYATNDIHGQIYPEEAAGRVGVGKLMTFLKGRKDSEKNSFIIDQGDTWQGSIYSNYNYGACITDIMNYVHFDARTVGNHDFDWGVDAIKANTAREYNGYKTPVLAGNVYDFNFETKQVGSIQQSDIGVPSVTYTLDNGAKVGIVGTIGSDQITSINSLYTRGIAFTNHINVIKQEATKLRQQGCQFVIASLHAGQGSAMNQNLGNYVDLVLCGHTHRQEWGTDPDGLKFVQFGQYTEGVGYIDLKYNASTKKVTLTSDGMYKYSQINGAVQVVDSTIQGIIDQYAAECNEDAVKVVLNNASSAFYNDTVCANLMAKAIYDTALEEGYDVDCSYVNMPRHYLPSGQWTFADVFEAFPFDNTIYIIEITADDYRNEIVNYNWICKSNTEPITLSPTETIKVACLDYLAWHTNSNRYYDYFPSVAKYTDISAVPTLSKTYRNILVDWLAAHDYDKEGHTLYFNDFDNNNPEFNERDTVLPNFTITFHLYDDVIDYTEAPYGETFGNYKIIDPERDDYTFDGWYFDTDYHYPVSNNYVIDENIDVYAKWIEGKINEADLYYTDPMYYTSFEVGSTYTSVAAINDGDDLVTLGIEHSEIQDNSQYLEWSILAGGYFHLILPAGYHVYSFSVDQFRYNNLAFYESDHVDPANQIDVDYSVPSADHTLYAKSGLSLTDLYIYNTYNGRISFYSVQFTLVKVSA